MHRATLNFTDCLKTMVSSVKGKLSCQLLHDCYAACDALCVATHNPISIVLMMTLVLPISGRLLLHGTYEIDKNSSAQKFLVTERYWGQFKYKYVTLKVLDNHGLADYTCLYRIRVHGEPSHGGHK